MSCSFIWDNLLVSSFSMTPCICFYLFGRSATSPNVDKGALCRRCPVEPSGAVSLVIWAWCSRGVHLVGLCSLLLQLSLNYRWHVSRSRWPSGCLAGDWLWLQRTSSYARTDPREGVPLAIESTFWVCRLWSCLGGALVWAEACHCVCWFWSLLGVALVQVKVSHCLCQSWSLLVEATKWSAVGCRLCCSWRCLAEAIPQTKAGCHLCWAWAPLVGTVMWAEGSCYLCQACGCFVEAMFQT